MEATPMNISALLATRKFFVPSYQRPYQWSADNAEQLVQDVYDSYEDKEKEYFIGSNICIKKSGRIFEVVDGQQRLITLTLILLQLAEKAQKEKTKDYLKKHVFEVKGAVNSQTELCIEVRDTENAFYKEHIVEGNPISRDHAVTANEKVFVNNCKRISKVLQTLQSDKNMTDEDMGAFADHLLDNVYVVFVTVDDRTSAFRLFHVLNKRGVELSDVDLIKNQILHKVHDSQDRTKEVEKKWLQIENLIGQENLNHFFVCHQISEKEDRNRVSKKTFDYYERKLNADDSDPMGILNMLLKSAGYYSSMLDVNNDIEPNKTRLFLKSLSKHSEWLPAFMAFRSKEFDEGKFKEFALLFEKVYMHSLFKDEASSKREAACYHAIEAINKGKSFDEIMASIRKLADNDGFAESLDKKNFYDEHRPRIINFVKSVLFRLDVDRQDSSASRLYPNWKEITVEHVLPRNMSNSYWQYEFDGAKHAEWVDKLGNLTLLARSKNSAARNYGFPRKKEEYERLDQVSPFKITQELCKLDHWNMDELQKRHAQMKGKILKLWEVDENLF